MMAASQDHETGAFADPTLGITPSSFCSSSFLPSSSSGAPKSRLSILLHPLVLFQISHHCVRHFVALSERRGRCYSFLQKDARGTSPSGASCATARRRPSVHSPQYPGQAASTSDHNRGGKQQEKESDEFGSSLLLCGAILGGFSSSHSLRVRASFPLPPISSLHARRNCAELQGNSPTECEEDSVPELDLNFCRERLQQHSATDPDLTLTGLYVVTTNVRQPTRLHAELLKQMSSSFDGVMALLLFDPTALGKNTMAPGGASSSSAERFFSVYKAAEVSNTITPHAVDAGAPVLSTVTKKQAAKRLETWYQEVDTTIAMGEVERIALNHVMHGTADERSNTTSQDHEHRNGLRQLILQERGLQALHSRARILQNYVSRVKAGTLPRNEPVLRSLMAFCRRLSTTSSLLDCSNSNPHQASPTLSLVQRSERPRSQDCSSDTPSESSMSLSHSCRRQTQVPSSSAETFSGCDTVGPSSDLRAKDAGQQRSREDVSTGLLPGNSGEDNVIVSAMPGKKTKDHERRTIADPLEERDRNMEETMETQEATVTREEAERTDVDSVMLQMSVLLSAMTEAVSVANRTTEKLLVAQSCTPRPGSPRHFVPCPSSSRGGHSS